MKRTMVGILGLAALAAAGAVQSQEQKIAGDVVKVGASTMQVRSAAGQVVDVALPGNVRLSGRAPSDASKITQGAFVGTAAVPGPDGTLVAREVHIFPESMRGTGEGHRPFPGEAGSTMTNATVAKIAGGQGGLTMKLNYKGGEKTVVVPPNVPVVSVEPADRSELVPGTHVIVYAAPGSDGKLAAQRVSIGKNGSVPPV